MVWERWALGNGADVAQHWDACARVGERVRASWGAADGARVAVEMAAAESD